MALQLCQIYEALQLGSKSALIPVGSALMPGAWMQRNVTNIMSPTAESHLLQWGARVIYDRDKTHARISPSDAVSN